MIANLEYGTREKEINTLIFHCNIFSLEDFSRICIEEGVSTHYFIDEEGKITCLAEEKNKAYHAGRGSWRGEDKMNDRSIGIELQNKTLGQAPYSKAQIDALTELSLDIIKRYNIAPTNIIGHSDSAPERKPDPGMSFPWQELAQRGIGLFPKFKEQAPKGEKALAADGGFSHESPPSYPFRGALPPGQVPTRGASDSCKLPFACSPGECGRRHAACRRGLFL